MLARIALAAALLLSLSVSAQAMCQDDLKELKPRIERIKTMDPPRYWLTMKWYGKAEAAEPDSEVECLNYLARARKALAAPAAGNGAGGGGEGPVQALGGNGAPQSVPPVQPITEAPPPNFAPPGTVPRP